jgi:hypothetical protein
MSEIRINGYAMTTRLRPHPRIDHVGDTHEIV